MVDIWGRTNDLVARSMMDGISKETTINKEGDEEQGSFNSVYMYADSGARRSPLKLGSLLNEV